MAQSPAFTTPGMPVLAGQSSAGGADMSQANRFTSGFNPAYSFVIDTVAGYTDNQRSPDGLDAHLGVLEFVANAWVDPNAWAYFVAAASEDALNVEEAAVHYVGFGGHNTVRIGRFFVDFGKQMQTHTHELRTVDRPLVLRTYLGDEIKGDGLEWDNWTSLGDSTALRWSIGAFSSLLPEADPNFDPTTTAAQNLTDPKHAQDFNYTARATGFTDCGTNGTFQLGASARAIPRYDFIYDPDPANVPAQSETNLQNVVYGLDATYGWVGDTGERRWTTGVELLENTGDNGANVDLNTQTLNKTFDKSVFGYLAWSDFMFDRYDSVGVQYSAAQLPDANQSNESEAEVYFTHNLSEFQRIRLVVSDFQSEANDDAFRVAVQYTAVLGAHGHGVNW